MQHSQLFSPEELSYSRQNALSMTYHLDQARRASSDPLEDPAIQFSRTVRTGRRGRPRVEVQPNLLSAALRLRPKTQVAETAGCSARTIRRRQLDYGIDVPRPGRPQINQDGGANDDFGPPPHSGMFGDDELDWCLAIIMQDFPTFGRRLAMASL
jgi:hypothetical protein